MAGRRARRAAGSAVGAVVLAAGVISFPGAAMAAVSTAGSAVSAAAVASCAPSGPDEEWRNLQDINHDRAQNGDNVTGAPGADGGKGAVDVLLTSDVRQTLTQAHLDGMPAAGPSDRFGQSIAFVRVDDDLCTDLAIGVPGADAGRGAVVIAKGSTTGIASGGAVRLTGSTAGEAFGAQVAVVGRDVFVAAPGRTVSGRVRAGAVDHFRLGSDGTPVLLETITENTSGVPGVAEQDDRFGEVLAATGQGDTWVDRGASTSDIGLVVGEPSEDAGSRADAGSVTVLSFSPDTHRLSTAQSIAQDTPGVGGVGESGDRFGAAVASTRSRGTWFVAVGVPGEGIGSLTGAGMVQTFSGASLAALRPSQSFTQNTSGVPGGVESGDRFGGAVAVGRFAECVGGNPVDLAVGAPGEDLGSHRDAGTVTLLPLGATGAWAPACRHAWYQGSTPSLGGVAESGDRLGATLGTSTRLYMLLEDEPAWDQVLIGVPYEDVGSRKDAGWVYGVAASSRTTADLLSMGQSEGQRAAGARFGASFGTSS